MGHKALSRRHLCRAHVAHGLGAPKAAPAAAPAWAGKQRRALLVPARTPSSPPVAPLVQGHVLQVGGEVGEVYSELVDML